MSEQSQDFWQAEDFEDTVAAALIACYETEVKQSEQKKIPKQWRWQDSTLAGIRKLGPYIPAGNRVIMSSEPGRLSLDLANDPLPESACFAIRRPDGYQAKTGMIHGYIMVFYVRKEKELPHNWRRLGGGAIYSLRTFAPGAQGNYGDTRYFTVDKTGDVLACDFYGFPKPGALMSAADVDLWANTTLLAFDSLHWETDRRFCWTITASESAARAHLGCMSEEIKSLLYARSLPMTSTGRKRPILHLVEAHKRRMRNGTDVDVTAFLRGQQTVEIGGTQFTVRAPATLRPQLSEASQQRFYEHAA